MICFLLRSSLDRRLAKSILILVPIFGLHFIFFEWMPYLRAINSEEFEFKFELPLMYLEALFNSFQVSTQRIFYFDVLEHIKIVHHNENSC